MNHRTDFRAPTDRTINDGIRNAAHLDTSRRGTGRTVFDRTPCGKGMLNGGSTPFIR